jgi:Raf kinase inhibitor-like YbhB/YbcL family protein
MPVRRRSSHRGALAALIVAGCCTMLAACGGSSATPTPIRIAPTLVPQTPVAGLPEMALESVFPDGGSYPGQYACLGQNTSPPLHWSNVPAGAQAFSVFMDDPDAGGTFTHWVVFNLPATATEVVEALPPTKSFDNGVKQGVNGLGKIGYTGPCPPKNTTHRYRFFVYALDAPLALDGGVTRQDVTNAMNGHILAIGKLTGTYSRP